MTSSDMSTLTLLLEKHFAETARQLSDMRADNAEFREQMQKDFAEFKDSVDEKFSRIHTEIGIMRDDITGLKHDVAGLYHWDYWLLSIIIAVIAMPQIASGVKLLFSAVAEGLGLIMSVFREKSRHQE